MNRATATAAATVCALQFIASAAPQDQTIRRRVTGVRIDAVVTAGGRPVTGLRAEDFDVRDNDVPQRIESFSLADGLSLGVVLDLSHSVQEGREEIYHHWRKGREGAAELLDAARSAVGALRDADESLLVTFTGAVELTTDVGKGGALVLNALNNPQWVQTRASKSLSRVWDAVFAAGGLVSGAPQRPVVMLFSDGIDNASWVSGDEMSRSLDTLGVTLDVITEPRTYDTDDWVPPESWKFNGFVERTGGITVSARGAKATEKLRARIEQLRQGYVLTFVPTGVKTGDGWHRLTVSVRKRSVRVEARQQYLAK